jgi:predicted GNAT family acetyltransferase
MAVTRSLPATPARPAPAWYRQSGATCQRGEASLAGQQAGGVLWHHNCDPGMQAKTGGGRMDIQHDIERQRFVLLVEGSEAVLEYRLLAGNGIDFTYTFVPPALRGRGIAEKLVRTGLSWARAQEYEIQASCWYVQRFIRPGK